MFVFLMILVGIIVAFAVTTQTTGTVGLAAEMKTFYDRTLIERAKTLLVHNQFGQKKPLPKNGGKTIEFRRFSALANNITALTEGVTPDGKGLEATAIEATVSQYGDYVQGSDLLVLTAIDPILMETAELLGEQAGESLDVICRDILNAGTSLQRAAGRVSRVTIAIGDILTVDEIRKAVRTLKRNKARPLADGYYVAIVEPGTTYDLQGDAKWLNAALYAGSTQLFTGEIGRCYGVRFVEATNGFTFEGAGATGIDVYSTLILGANAYGSIPLEGGALDFIFKPLGTAGTADPLDQRWTSGWKATQTWKILNDLFMIRIEHAVSG